jgi:general secretion pathway protein F
MNYRYGARNSNGEVERGNIKADSPRMARQILRERQLLVYSLAPARDVGSLLRIFRLRGLKRNELMLFTRQFSTLVGASLTIEEALLTLAKQSEKSTSHLLLTRVRDRILEGQSLSVAMNEEPGTFNSLYRALIAAGESSGQLAHVLMHLADHLEQQEKMKGKIIEVLLYPFVLTIVAIGVIATLLTTVVPRVTEQFIHLKHELPLSTRVLLKISDWVLLAGPTVLITMIAIWAGLSLLLRRENLRKRWDRWWLKLPIIGRVLKDLNVARFARTLSILVSSGVPMLDAMRKSEAVCSNAHILSLVQEAQKKILEGVAFTDAMNSTGLLSPMMRHMISSGEKSGKLGSMLERAATQQEQAFQRQSTLAVGVITPLIVILMAGIVFFIVLAILQPILQLNTLIG